MELVYGRKKDDMVRQVCPIIFMSIIAGVFDGEWASDIPLI